MAVTDFWAPEQQTGMRIRLKLNELTDRFDTLDFPATREEVLDELGDTILQYADGEERLGDVLSRSTTDVYQDPDELDAEIRGNLSTEALGEPGQSEGEG